jgi:5'-methylthioadenosine phosphorylase
VSPRPARVGLLGGSGVYNLSALEGAKEQRLETPFGSTSDVYLTGTLAGVPVAFCSRHGRGHLLSPSEINYRANIFGFKLLGCDAILSVSAVGSLQEKYAPRHAVVPDQFIDRTRHRPDTFFGEGIVAHVAFADPICPSLAAVLEASAKDSGVTVHRGGIYVCMEGPQFSTRAESALYRSWGGGIVGMTNLTEAKLAREAEICYASLALVTDYDCWREATDAVSVDAVLSVLADNSDAARQALTSAVGRVDPARLCGCRDALRSAILTDPRVVPKAARERLWPIVGRYLEEPGPVDGRR